MHSATADARTPTAALVSYALPASAVGFTMLLVDAYLLKYATDTLLVPAGWMAALIWLPRVWDALSDPMVGHWSDRTRTRFGRRRPWIASGVIPMGAAFCMLWGPPASLEGAALAAWLGAALLLFYTGTTLLDVPHFALGAELCDDYDERTRLFGVRRLLIGVGAVGSVAAIYALEQGSDPALRRATGLGVGAAGALLIALTVPWSVWTTRERAGAARLAPTSALRAFGHVLANPHARLLLIVAFVQQGAIAALVAALPFYSDYVLETPGQSWRYIGVVLLASFAGVPIVLRIAPGYDKRTLVTAAMIAIALLLSLLGLAGPGDVALVIGVAACAGLAGAVLDTVGPSLQADVIDYDESITGERKEGAYFALWAFVAKLSRATALVAVAGALELLDFVPNAAPPPETVRGLGLLTGWLPALLYAVGTVLFARYRLTRAEHERIRSVLAERARGRTPPGPGPGRPDLV